ncbi:hypothetical protein Pla110_10270 [Polystyrenella longa]|uniref:RiboL-PSP-HEPN domain-containing protein n=1 Tax=Polystyrenella longa TaxID=2528007 RepID=A0A518CJA9_9PLAN|nr:hypothetical protein [Polystyrenella longa]QDU79319.1 hypothetical protein Pla110_10270 [Polystyrenella longa]
MSTTPFLHFTEDIERVEAILNLAEQQLLAGGEALIINDLHASAIASSFGAMDAYLCDKYVDCVTAVLKAYVEKKWQGDLPAHYAKTMLPAGEVLKTTRQSRPNWGIRMSARKLMERNNMLSISIIHEHFNPILSSDHKLWGDFIPILIAKNRKRFTKVVPDDLLGLNNEKTLKLRKSAIAAVKKRIGSIVQIRHDWIHNCGRPKSSINKYSKGQAKAFVNDIKTLVQELDKFIEDNRRA